MSVLSSISLLSDAKYFDDKNSKFNELKENLDHKTTKKRLSAMKRLIAMMTLGRDVSSFFPDVVKNVIVDNTEIKKLVYMFLTHYAEDNQELALLAINTLQKDLGSSNQRVRANALRAMSSISIKVVIPLVMIALNNAVRDTSSYVRKAAACAVPKVWRTDPSKKPELVEMIAELLSNTEPNVLGASIFAFNQVCPERLDLLHIHFRKICALLADFDYFGQAVTLKVLTRYARTQFLTPFRKKQAGKDDDDSDDDGGFDADEPFYDNDEDEDEKKDPDEYNMDPDHRLLIRSATILLNSADSAVITGVCSLMFSIAPIHEARQCAPAIARHLSNYREIQYVVLTNVSTMAAKRPSMFRQYVKMFFVYFDDPAFIRTLKLDILAHLASDGTIGPILLELFSYTHHYDGDFVNQAIRTIGRCAMTIPDVAERCLHMLLRLVSTSTETVVAQAISVIRQLLQRDPKSHVSIIKRMAKLLFKVKIAMARTALVWIVGEYREMIPKVAPDCLRQLAKTFKEEDVEVKLQVLNLAVKLYLSNPKETSLLFKYIMDLSKNDQNFDVRDRARMVRSLFFKKKGEALNDPSTELKTKTKMLMKRCFLWAKPVPETENPFKARETLTLGSLSHVVQHSVQGYQALPEFPTVAPDRSVREPPRSALDEVADRRRAKASRKYSNVDDFYKSSSDSDSDEDTDSSDSDEDEDTSDSDEEDKPKQKRVKKTKDDDHGNDEDSDSSSSGSDSDSNSDSDSDSEDDNDKPQVRTNNTLSQPQPAAQTNVGGLLNLLDDDDDDQPVTTNPAPSAPSQQPDIFASLTFEDNFIGGGRPATNSSSDSKDQVQLFDKIRMPRHGSKGVLLKESLGEGMEVQYAFIRQDSIYSKTMSVVELTFLSKVEVRDIHMTSVDVKQMEVRKFDKIPVLHAHQSTTANLHIDFKGSERKLKFSIGTTDRTYPVTLAPKAGDLLKSHPMSISAFDTARKRLTGMQETSFVTSKATSTEDLASKITKFVDIAVLSLNPSNPKLFRLSAHHRHDPSQLVLISVDEAPGGKYNVTINCDDMLFSGSLSDYLHKAIGK